MTESESPSRSRFNKSMLGRLAAVSLFLGLGTLAVMHTVTNRKPTDPNAPLVATEDPDAANNSEATSASSTASKSPAPPQAKTDLSSSLKASWSPNQLSSTPATNPPSLNPNLKSSDQNRQLTAPPIVDASSRIDSPNRLPAAKVSNLSELPPPTRSFSDSPNSKSSENDLRSKDVSPIVSAQIQVDADRDSPSSFGSGIKSVAAPPSTTSPLSKTANPLFPTITKPNLNSISDDSTQSNLRPTTTATPYDSPSLNVAPRKLAESVESASKLLPQTDVPTLNNPPRSTANNALAPLSQSKPPQDFPPIRSAVDTPSNSSNSFGSSTLQPRSSLASSSRPLDATANAAPKAEALSVQATPGATNLDGPQVPSLKLQKIAPREVQINKPAELKLIVQNNGQIPATQVGVYDRVPEGTKLIDSTPKANQSADGTLSWNLGTIAPGETSEITINLLPVRPGEFGSVAQITFAAQASARTLCTQPILSLKHSTKPKVLIGDEVVLDITIENNGDGPATNVMLQENIPDLLTFDDGSRELEFEIGTLAPGQKRNVQLRLKAAKVGTTQNRIVVQGDADLQAFDVVDLEIIAPDLHATGEGPDRKYLNRQSTHEFALANSGTAAATNVDLVARLPRGLKFVSANNHGQFDATSNAVYWSLQQLAAGQTGRVDLVTMPIEPGEQKIDFEATADLNQKTSVSKLLTVESLVELFCEIDDLTDPIEIGSETAYRVKVVNQGLQAANNIRLNVDFPTGIQPMSVNGNIPNQIQGQRVVFSAIERLDAQQETVVTITAKGTVEGDHRVVVSMSSDARETQIAKEESTQVYSDRR